MNDSWLAFCAWVALVVLAAVLATIGTFDNTTFVYGGL